MQNFCRVNFWRLVARYGIGREKFGESGLSRVVYMATFKSLVGKILAGLDKSAESTKICTICRVGVVTFKSN